MIALLSSLLTVFSVIIIILLTFALLFALWFVVKPYIFYKFYKEQGAQGYFRLDLRFLKGDAMKPISKGDFAQYLEKVANHQPTVKAVTSNFGTETALYLIDADLIKEFLNQPQFYKKAELVSGIQRLFQKQGLLYSEGQLWTRQRKILTACLHNELLRTQVPAMARLASQVYAQTIEKTRKSKGLSLVDIKRINQRVAGDIIGQLFFGHSYVDCSFEGKPITVGFKRLLEETEKETFTIYNMLLGTWLLKTGIFPRHKMLFQRVENFRQIIKAIMEEAKKNAHENTLLGSLMQHQGQSPEHSMFDDQIIDNFVAAFQGGTEPSGNLCSLVLYYLTQNPKAYQKTVEEIEQVVRSEQEITFEQSQKLDFTLAVIKETLRLANPQTFLVFRRAIEDHDLKEFYIKKGTLVNFSPLFNSYNPKYFPDPYEFIPERWLAGAKKTREFQDTPFAFIPFSAGPRACVGNHFALIQVKVMLSILLKTFNVDISPRYKLKMSKRSIYEPLEDLKITLTPK